jgi:cysteine desulfurase
LIYLDSASTTFISPNVKKEIDRAMDCLNCNPSNLYKEGLEVKQYIEDTKTNIDLLLNGGGGKIYFTSSGSEANTWVINKSVDKIIISGIEHSSIMSVDGNKRDFDYNYNILQTDEYGFIDPDMYDQFLSWGEDSEWYVKMVSIIMANNEIGTIQDIKKLASMAHAHGYIFHTDITQALPHMKINMQELGVDIATFSGHKFHAPKGIGVVWISDGMKYERYYHLPTLIYGGKQEDGIRGGTENILGIAGLNAAVNDLRCVNFDEIDVKYNDFKKAIIRGLEDGLGKDAFRVNSPSHDCVSSIINIAFHGVHAESLMLALDELYDIKVSTGSACEAGSASHVLSNIVMSNDSLKDISIPTSSIRISFDENTTTENISTLIGALVDTVKILKENS